MADRDLHVKKENRPQFGTSEFYAYIGRMGGKKGRTGGFYGNRERASSAGRKGGLTKAKRHSS